MDSKIFDMEDYQVGVTALLMYIVELLQLVIMIK